MLAQMGTEVHVFYRQPTPLRGFDQDVRDFLAEQLAAKGITLHPNSSPTAVEKTANGREGNHPAPQLLPHSRGEDCQP
eukprot:1891525-Pyramimonas_sp.AAC.1